MVATLGWLELPGSWNLAIFIPADVACQVCPAVDKVPSLTTVGDQGEEQDGGFHPVLL